MAQKSKQFLEEQKAKEELDRYDIYRLNDATVKDLQESEEIGISFPIEEGYFEALKKGLPYNPDYFFYWNCHYSEDVKFVDKMVTSCSVDRDGPYLECKCTHDIMIGLGRIKRRKEMS